MRDTHDKLKDKFKDNQFQILEQTSKTVGNLSWECKFEI